MSKFLYDQAGCSIPFGTTIDIETSPHGYYHVFMQIFQVFLAANLIIKPASDTRSIFLLIEAAK